jgi:uncharacterized protein (DUF362 family)/NAD-dependent dihydropyrimidine dehydrogenase PreA subunit
MPVSIVKTKDPKDVRKAIDLLGGIDKFVKRGDSVLVKPNICAGKPTETGTVTSPELVAEVCRLVAECGGLPFVAESPIYPYKSAFAFPKAGYDKFEERTGFRLVDLDSAPQVEIKVPKALVLKNEVLAKPALEADVIINVAKMKSHLQTIVSLGLKNIKGFVPRRNKHIVHMSGLDSGIVDLNRVIKPGLTIIEGIIAMEGTLAPTNGTPREVGLIFAGTNPVETDATCARVMGVEPLQIPHIALAEKEGIGMTSGFDVLGSSVEDVRLKEFELPRSLLTRGVTTDIFKFGFWMMTSSYHVVANPILRLMGKEAVRRDKEIGEWMIDYSKCDNCRLCTAGCPTDVLKFVDGKIVRVKEGCIYCFCCSEVCPLGAISKVF